jgi:hypothetical protein
MSHFTNIRTRFQNLFYLERALNKLHIDHEKEEKVSSIDSKIDYYTNLRIPQLNGHDIKFCWNQKEYELVVDMSYWSQPYTVELFIDKITQQYAGEVIIGESKKIGFQPVKYQQTDNGSNILVLERWNKNGE